MDTMNRMITEKVMPLKVSHSKHSSRAATSKAGAEDRIEIPSARCRLRACSRKEG